MLSNGLILSGGTHQVATANLDFWLNSSGRPASAPDHCGMQPGAAGRNAAGVGLETVGLPTGRARNRRGSGAQAGRLSARKGTEFFCWAAKGTWPSGRRSCWRGTILAYASWAPIHPPRRTWHGWIIVIFWTGFMRPSRTFFWLRWEIPSRKNGFGCIASVWVCRWQWAWAGSFEILVGDMRRAPQWIQQLRPGVGDAICTGALAAGPALSARLSWLGAASSADVGGGLDAAALPRPVACNHGQHAAGACMSTCTAGSCADTELHCKRP